MSKPKPTTTANGNKPRPYGPQNTTYDKRDKPSQREPKTVGDSKKK